MPTPTIEHQPAGLELVEADPPRAAESEPPPTKRPPPVSGGYPQAIVLLGCLAALVALAYLDKLDLGAGAVLMSIAAAAGAVTAALKGKAPPAGGAAAMLLFGAAELGATVLPRWRI